MATAKKAPAKKAPAAAKAPATASPKKAATPAKKAAPAPAKKAAVPAKKVAPATVKKATLAAIARKGASAPVAKKAAVPVVTKKAPATKAVAPVKAAPVKAAPVESVPAKLAPAKVAAVKTASAKTATGTTATPLAAKPVTKAAPKKVGPVVPEKAPVRGVTKEGISYTKDFDAKFLTAQRALLLQEKASLVGQAVRLEDEALALITEQEMGDVQFDDEGGEGDTMVVERERDLALSAQARQTVADIEAALARLIVGTYGYSIESGRPISRERLEAIPWATVLVEEKVGGIGRR